MQLSESQFELVLVQRLDGKKTQKFGSAVRTLGNRRAGVALAARHRHIVVLRLWAQGRL